MTLRSKKYNYNIAASGDLSTNNLNLGVSTIYSGSFSASNHVSTLTNVTGNTNTVLGFNSGCCITSGANNVILGSASANGFGTQSCNIFISDGAGNVRIFVTGSTGFTGIGPGFTAPTYPLHVSGSSGGVSIYATNDIAAYSDESVKTELQIIDNALEKIEQIHGYTYLRVDDDSKTRRAGVIAQEIQKVLPEVVTQNPDGTLNVAYSNLVALLIEAIKELNEEIKELKSK